MNRPEHVASASMAPAGPVDPRGPAYAPRRERNLIEPAIVGLFALALLVALHAAATLVVPMVTAVIFGSVIAHVGDRAQRIGRPPIVVAAGLVAATGLGLFVFGSALAEALVDLIDRLPQIATRVDGLISGLLGPFETLRGRLLGVSPSGGTGEGGIGRLASAIDMESISGFLAGLTPAFGEVLIFLATLAFFVAGRTTLRRDAILSFEERENRLAAIRVFNACEAALATYFDTTAAIYLGVGTATAVIAWSAGLAAPVLWGVATVLLSFVPFLGPAIVAFGLLSAGLLTHDGLLAAASPASAFLVVHLVSENAVVPAILGRRFEINPFVVFLAIVSGTWMWGAMGAVLAVPLLLVARTVHGAMRGEPECGLPDGTFRHDRSSHRDANPCPCERIGHPPPRHSGVWDIGRRGTSERGTVRVRNGASRLIDEGASLLRSERTEPFRPRSGEVSDRRPRRSARPAGRRSPTRCPRRRRSTASA